MSTNTIQTIAAAIFRHIKGLFAPLDHTHSAATPTEAGFMSPDDKKALSELYQPISSMAEVDFSSVSYLNDSGTIDGVEYPNGYLRGVDAGTVIRSCPNIYYEYDAIVSRWDAIYLGSADDTAFIECYWIAVPRPGYALLDGDYSHYGIYHAFCDDASPEFVMDDDHGEFAQESLQERFAAAMAGNTVRHSHRHDASDIESGTIPIDRLPVGSSDKNVAAGNHTHSVADVQNNGLMSAADKSKLDGFPSVWTGTQAEYDALATKSSTTLYFITE